MLEYNQQLNLIFKALGDTTRRDILYRLRSEHLNIGDIAKSYGISLAAVSLHIKVLEKAKLIIRRKQGRTHVIEISPEAFVGVNGYLQNYEALWKDKLSTLKNLVEEENQ